MFKVINLRINSFGVHLILVRRKWSVNASDMLVICSHQDVIIDQDLGHGGRVSEGNSSALINWKGLYSPVKDSMICQQVVIAWNHRMVFVFSLGSV